MSIELPPIGQVFTLAFDAVPREFVSRIAQEARERILLARVAELDLALAIARQNAELLTGYWKAAGKENKLLRSIIKENGIDLADYDIEDDDE